MKKPAAVAEPITFETITPDDFRNQGLPLVADDLEARGVTEYVIATSRRATCSFYRFGTKGFGFVSESRALYRRAFRAYAATK